MKRLLIEMAVLIAVLFALGVTTEGSEIMNGRMRVCYSCGGTTTHKLMHSMIYEFQDMRVDHRCPRCADRVAKFGLHKWNHRILIKTPISGTLTNMCIMLVATTKGHVCEVCATEIDVGEPYGAYCAASATCWKCVHTFQIPAKVKRPHRGTVERDGKIYLAPRQVQARA